MTRFHLFLAWQETMEEIKQGAGPDQLQPITSLAEKATKKGTTSLMLACRLPNKPPSFQASSVVRELLAAKADPARASDEYQLTALHVAAENGHRGVVQDLVEVLSSEQIDSRLVDGKTPLMLACKHNHPRTAQVLLEAKEGWVAHA